MTNGSEGSNDFHPEALENRAGQDLDLSGESSDVSREPIIPEGSTEPDQNHEETLSRWGVVKRTGQSAVALAALSPLNEVVRLSAYGATEALTRNSVASGVVLGLSTFAIEGAAGLAAADLYDTGTGQKLSQAIRKRSKHIDEPIDVESSSARTALKTFWTFLGGSVVGMTLEQRDNPNRTKEQNQRYSVFTATWQGGALAVIGFMGSEFVNTTLENPEKGAIVAGSLAAIGGLGAIIHKKIAEKGGALWKKIANRRTDAGEQDD